MSAPPRLRDMANLDRDALDMLRAASRTQPLGADDRARLRPRLDAARAGLAVTKGGLIGAKGIAAISFVVLSAASSAWLLRGRSARSNGSVPAVVTRGASSRNRPASETPAATPALPVIAATPAPRATGSVHAAAPAAIEVTATPEPSIDARAPVMPPASRRSHAVDSLAEEAAEVDDALTLLATNPGAALVRVDRAARTHPNGQLASQREAIAVDALFRLHRDAEAIRRGEALLARHADGLAAERIRGLLHAHRASRGSAE